MLLTLYWRRATRSGVLAGMIGGFLTVVLLHVLGWVDSRSQRTVKDYHALVAKAAQTGQPAPEPPPRALWLQENLNWIPGWGEERHDPFNPLFVGGVDTLVWGMLVALVLSVGVSLMTQPDLELAKKYFP